MATKSLVHLNSNMLCAIDCETTGPIAGHHDLIQVCIFPLDSELKPYKKVTPFYMELQPRRPHLCSPEHEVYSREKVCHAMISGMDADKSADLFDEWYKKLRLPDNKRISPLAHDWVHDCAFVCDWLGQLSFDRYFDARYRDTMTAALFENDRADFLGEPCPYPKVDLTYLASTLKIEFDRRHDPLSDCVTTAEVYRQMIKKGIYA